MRLFNILKELTKRVTANTIGERINIKSYTETNMYTCPSDGYIFLYISSTSTAGMVTLGTVAANFGGAVGRTLVYVKKGTKVYVSGNPDIAAFVPISSGGGA